MPEQLTQLLEAIAQGTIEERASAEKALRGLQAKGQLDDAGVLNWMKALAKRCAAELAAWHGERSPASLNAIYYRLIDALPEGTPLAELVAVLGAPDTALPATARRGESCTYAAGEGASVYLEADHEGKLVAWRST